MSPSIQCFQQRPHGEEKLTKSDLDGSSQRLEQRLRIGETTSFVVDVWFRHDRRKATPVQPGILVIVVQVGLEARHPALWLHGEVASHLCLDGDAIFAASGPRPPRRRGRWIQRMPRRTPRFHWSEPIRSNAQQDQLQHWEYFQMKLKEIASKSSPATKRWGQPI
eukprot:Protomagalhaensia_sp_Gyna_25__3780@NODE_339_length_3817_cov_120_097935_g265_i0_p3_GENE_NODE_339_length_3817_cov_120_097935_g265_i0NODE_339_length_3817_cov_120_097935_g265_i0_p3_ORF_typecomplete_len165_score11_57DUF401/PF04165_12/0_21_NODE_339_length_3817_cov_120_097935_g265_i0373867